MKPITPLKIFMILMVLAPVALPASAASPDTVHGGVSGHVSTSYNVPMADVQVMLVNASNTSETIGNFSMAVDSNGFFQFTGVPSGDYKAFAWGSHLATGMSNNISVSENVTYNCAVVLVPEPFYSNMTVSRNPIYLEGDTTQITVTLYDYWENRMKDGWMVTMSTTAGRLDPPYGLTTDNGQFTTTLISPDVGNYATVSPFARGKNGTYYPLQKRIEAVNLNATPTPAPTATAQPSPTVTVSPNATAVPTPIGSPLPTSTPAATPTPGFESLAALAALGTIVIAARQKK